THQRAYVTLVDLIVVGVGVGHRQIGVQPGIDLRLRGARNVDATVVRAWDYTALVVEGSSEAVVDPVVRGCAAERQIVGSSLSGSKKAADVVVEDGPRRIRRAEIRERAARHAARTKDALQVGFRSGALEPEAVAVLKAAARSTAFGGNDDGSVRRIDSVEGGSLG